MRDLSLHILDIAENSVEAGARRIGIRIVENHRRDRLTLEIVDDGRGMDRALRERARDPFFTTKKERRIGLGLPMLVRAARAAGGTFSLSSHPGRKTKVRAMFQMSHIDRQPLGDIAQTLAVLIAGHPDIDIRYVHKVDGWAYVFDTKDLRVQLGAVSLATPHATTLITKDIHDGLTRIRRIS
ncbi:MAG: ATP-binding protein [Candidatus Aminicenantes bacterium]|nr:ATP-binding protein [Candidatus Aminicenantes bacterium]